MIGREASAVRLGQLISGDRRPQFSVLHLATHGVTDRQVALQSALVLAPDGVGPAGREPDNGRVTAEEILRTWQFI